MLDTSYKHFDINSNFKIPKKYGSVQNMSFRELQKMSKKNVSLIFAMSEGLKPLKKIHQMKDKIKCNKTPYIFLNYLEI